MFQGGCSVGSVLTAVLIFQDGCGEGPDGQQRLCFRMMAAQVVGGSSADIFGWL